MSDDPALSPPPGGVALLPVGTPVPPWLYRVAGGPARIGANLLVHRDPGGGVHVAAIGGGPAVHVAGRAEVEPAPGVRLYGATPATNRPGDVARAWLTDRRLWVGLVAGAALVLLSGCGIGCGPEPPSPSALDQSAPPGAFRERLRWESCMGRLPDPAVPVRIVR